MEISDKNADNSAVKLLIGGIEELFMQLPIALYRSAPDGELLAANEALAHLLGYDTIAELMDSVNSVESVHVDPTQRIQWLDEIAAHGVARDFDVELRRRDGTTVWIQDTARAVFDDDGQMLYCEGALIDVTEKVKAKKARDEFVATVSHELRNPVSVLLGLAHEMFAQYESFTDEERREIASVMAQQADDASWIIEDLLVAYREDMSQIAYRAESFDVREEIRRVLESVEANIETDIDAGAALVSADPRRTRQILRNLVSNAIRYGGEEVKVSTRLHGDKIDILISDSGEALDPDEAQRIFESYERGSGLLDSRSVGLGLSVARKLSVMMGGRLEYEHDGHFSSFIVTLPAAS
jgi:PAS domain S-box-containing protein